MATRCLLVAALTLSVGWVGWSSAADAPKTCDEVPGSHFADMCKKTCAPNNCSATNFTCFSGRCPPRFDDHDWPNCKKCIAEYFGPNCARYCHDVKIACHGRGTCIPEEKPNGEKNERAGFCNCNVEGYIGDDCNTCDFTKGYFMEGEKPKMKEDGRYPDIICKKHTPTEADKHNVTAAKGAAGEGECEKPNLFWPILIATIATIGFVGAALLVYVLMALKASGSAAGAAGKGAQYNEL